MDYSRLLQRSVGGRRPSLLAKKLPTPTDVGRYPTQRLPRQHMAWL